MHGMSLALLYCLPFNKPVRFLESFPVLTIITVVDVDTAAVQLNVLLKNLQETRFFNELTLSDFGHDKFRLTFLNSKMAFQSLKFENIFQLLHGTELY